ncbi:SUMO protease ULP2 Ecym_4350 [Eremothecium cymbalariae DBVPG|uniref:Ubiquitin-like protease family profile domain-containing protein n=1 Tax=Eremothecium cymbalariae (strain CBS 270.75 / DBVPG 7215 / KCTC 17166 / NRRL Y-17582) TaxID=931890 RepID=G8JTQ8_ERECY|nr:hypothetical protein Ecym_4350 [Eremothecium cymbalariae DBVPG\
MNRHKRAGLTPMNTLVTHSRESKGPTRHTGDRYQLERQKHVSKVSEGVIRAVELSECIPPSKKYKLSPSPGLMQGAAAATSSSNGLLPSAESDLGNLADAGKYATERIVGYLELFDDSGDLYVIENVLLEISFGNGSKEMMFCDLKSVGDMNVMLSLNLLKDVRMFYFDMHTTCVGLQLVTDFYLNVDDGKVLAKMIIWGNNGDKSEVRLIGIEDRIKKAGFKISNTGSKRIIEESMKQDLVSRVVRQKTDKGIALLGKTLKSLNNTKGLKKKYGKSGQVINLPGNAMPVESSDSDTSPGKGIASNSFYGSVKTSPLKSKISEHTYSSLRKSSRLLEMETESHLLLDDDDLHEVPEVFKPSLHYLFGDDTKYSVTNQDFKCLYNHDWINDTILDFFVKYYVEQAISTQSVEKEEVFILSSFFYTKLVSNLENCYLNVKKWVTNSNLMERKYVVIPINVNFHWFGCIITNLHKVLRFFKKGYYSRWVEQANSNSNFPEHEEVNFPMVSILVYDSLRQTHSREVDPIKMFLIAYVKDKYGFEIPRMQIRMKMCTVPQQPNMSDCGVHLILNTKKFFENPKKAIALWFQKPSLLLTKEINSYFDKKQRKSARKELRQVLWNLQQEQIEHNGTSNDSDISGDCADHSDIEIIEKVDEIETQTQDVDHKEGSMEGMECSSEYNIISGEQFVKLELVQTDGSSLLRERPEISSGSEDRMSISPESNVMIYRNDENQRHYVAHSSSVVREPNNRRHLSSSPERIDTVAKETGVSSVFFQEKVTRDTITEKESKKKQYDDVDAKKPHALLEGVGNKKRFGSLGLRHSVISPLSEVDEYHEDSINQEIAKFKAVSIASTLQRPNRRNIRRVDFDPGPTRVVNQGDNDNNDDYDGDDGDDVDSESEELNLLEQAVDTTAYLKNELDKELAQDSSDIHISVPRMNIKTPKPNNDISDANPKKIKSRELIELEDVKELSSTVLGGSSKTKGPTSSSKHITSSTSEHEYIEVQDLTGDSLSMRFTRGKLGFQRKTEGNQ